MTPLKLALLTLTLVAFLYSLQWFQRPREDFNPNAVDVVSGEVTLNPGLKQLLKERTKVSGQPWTYVRDRESGDIYEMRIEKK